MLKEVFFAVAASREPKMDLLALLCLLSLSRGGCRLSIAQGRKLQQQHKQHGRKYVKREGYRSKVKPKERIRLVLFNMDKGISSVQVQLRMAAGVDLLCVPETRFKDVGCRLPRRGGHAMPPSARLIRV